MFWGSLIETFERSSEGGLQIRLLNSFIPSSILQPFVSEIWWSMMIPEDRSAVILLPERDAWRQS